MVEAEAPSAVEEPQQEADGKVEISQSAEAPPGSGESPLKPPKRLPKPDKDMYKQKEEAMHSTIKLRKARILEINNLLDGKRNQADSPQLVALKNKQANLRAAWDAELVSVHACPPNTQLSWALNALCCELPSIWGHWSGKSAGQSFS